MGTVYKAKNIHLKNTVAVKMIKRIIGKDDQNEESYIKKEIFILKKMIHPNVVQIYEFYSDIKYYQLVMEYCKKGELSQYIKKSFSEKQLAIIFYQILSGLCYLHDNDIIHEDIKLNNIMIKDIEEDINTKEEYFWIKLVDFHTANIFEKNIKNSKNVKKKYYNSPEALNNDYTKESDLWSVGVLLHILLVGKVPFDGNTDEDINNKIKNESFNELEPRLIARSPEVRDLLNKLLEKDKKKRITAEVALKHGWFIKYKGRDLFSNFSPDDIQQYIHNLCTYSCESKISQLVLAFIVHNMPESLSILTILKLFRYFNLSGNCKLTKAELRKGLHNYRNEEQIDNIVDQLFLVLDGDNNGFIEFEEFLRACVDKKKVLTKDNIWHAFKFLDDNNTNSIDVQTLMRAFDARPNKMLEAVFNKTLNNVQLDNNGKISFNEFEQIILNSLKE
jgi:calcium-dependent protein kinase